MSEIITYVVDDSRSVTIPLTKFLKDKNYVNVKMFNDDQSFLNSLSEDVSIVVMDYLLKDITAFDLIPSVRKKSPDCMVIMISATHDFDTILRALNEFHVNKWLDKTSSDFFDKLYRVLIEANEHIKRHNERQRKKMEFIGYAENFAKKLTK